MEKQQNQNSELNLWWRETSKKKRETTCKILLEKKEKTRSFFCWLKQTYLSRHECLGNNSARDNNIANSVNGEKETNTSTQLALISWPSSFLPKSLGEKREKEKSFTKKKKGCEKKSDTLWHAYHHHEQLGKPNPLNQCFLLHRPDQCSLRPSDTINNNIKQPRKTRVTEANKRVHDKMMPKTQKQKWWSIWKRKRALEVIPQSSISSKHLQSLCQVFSSERLSFTKKKKMDTFLCS